MREIENFVIEKFTTLDVNDEVVPNTIEDREKLWEGESPPEYELNFTALESGIAILVDHEGFMVLADPTHINEIPDSGLDQIKLMSLGDRAAFLEDNEVFTIRMDR